MYKINIEQSKSTVPTLKCNNLYLHSKYNPLKEAKDFIEKYYKPVDKHILIGYGLGYIYSELDNRKGTNEKVIVIDPLLNFSDLDYPEDMIVLKDLDKQKLKEFFQENLSLLDKINIMVSINYENILNEQLKIILQALEEVVKSHEIVENTLAFFSNQWNENYVKNLKFAEKDKTVDVFEGLFDCPIVVASGGPSLTKQLPLLKVNRDKIILIAAGSTINSLLSNDIRPDFVVSVDGGEFNAKHFESLSIKDFPLIYCPTVHYKVRKSFEEAYTFFPKIEESLASHYIKYAKKEIPILLDGSSVANNAYNLAIMMTSGPVALIGQDLAYTNNLSHAEGNKGLKELKKNTGLIQKEGYYGELVITNNVFLQMRDAFENMNKFYRAESRSFNCTEGGLKINYFKQLSFKDFLSNFAQKKFKMDSTDSENLKNIVVKEEYLENLRADIKNLKKLIVCFEEALDVLHKNDSKIGYSEKTLKLLEKVDLDIQNLLPLSNLEFAFNLINLRVLKYFKIKETDSFEEKFKVSYNQSRYMYKEMLKITNESLLLYKEELERKGE